MFISIFEDEFGNRVLYRCSLIFPLTVQFTGSYTLIPTQYPSRLSYDSSAGVFTEILLRCTQGGYNLVPLHAVTFAYNQTSERTFTDEVKGGCLVCLQEKSNIVVRL